MCTHLGHTKHDAEPFADPSLVKNTRVALDNRIFARVGDDLIKQVHDFLQLLAVSQHEFLGGAVLGDRDAQFGDHMAAVEIIA